MRFFTIMGSWLENGDCALQHFNEWLPVGLQRLRMILTAGTCFDYDLTQPVPARPDLTRPNLV